MSKRFGRNRKRRMREHFIATYVAMGADRDKWSKRATTQTWKVIRLGQQIATLERALEELQPKVSMTTNEVNATIRCCVEVATDLLGNMSENDILYEKLSNQIVKYFQNYVRRSSHG